MPPIFALKNGGKKNVKHLLFVPHTVLNCHQAPFSAPRKYILAEIMVYPQAGGVDAPPCQTRVEQAHSTTLQCVAFETPAKTEYARTNRCLISQILFWLLHNFTI